MPNLKLVVRGRMEVAQGARRTELAQMHYIHEQGPASSLRTKRFVGPASDVLATKARNTNCITGKRVYATMPWRPPVLVKFQRLPHLKRKLMVLKSERIKL